MADNTMPALSVADVLRKGLRYYTERFGVLPRDTARILASLQACRTQEAGMHQCRCPHCGHREIAYNSCRNRHCPRCQSHKAMQWSEARTRELLPVPYFHIVFTIPHELNGIALQNRDTFYNLLFRAASDTLTTLAADKKRLGCRIGFFAVLHTWTQTLMDHPHVHVVIPGGGITPDGEAFKRTRPDYIFPVKVMSALFRGKLLAYIKSAIAEGRIQFNGSLEEMREPKNQQVLFNELYKRDFVVYAKQPFAGPRQVVRYLSRYTHRVAISDRRIKNITQDMVSFTWRDRADSNAVKTMTVESAEFIRRFLLHLLPHGFMKIRYYGFMANTVRKKAFELCMKLLAERMHAVINEIPTGWQPVTRRRCCPRCNQAPMLFDGLVVFGGSG